MGMDKTPGKIHTGQLATVTPEVEFREVGETIGIGIGSSLVTMHCLYWAANHDKFVDTKYFQLIMISVS
jgi:hypothetical protein